MTDQDGIDEEAATRCQVLLIKGVNLKDLPERTPWVDKLQEGDYRPVIESEFTLSSLEESCDAEDDFDPVDRITKSLEDIPSRSLIDQLQVLIVGISCLNAFIQVNWTGPPFERSAQVYERVKKLIPSSEDDSCGDIRTALGIDGEEISDSIEHPELLIVALGFLRCPVSLASREWWLMRTLYIYQQILDEHSPRLHEELSELSKNVEEGCFVQEEPALKVILSLETSRIHLHYGRVTNAEENINRVLNLLNLDVIFSGALGRRTRYQQRDLPQLTIQIDVKKTEALEDESLDIPPEGSFVKDVPVNDDVRLAQIAYFNPSDGEIPELSPIALAALIGMFVLKKKSEAKDPLQNETLKLITFCLISQPKVWSVHAAALLFRSRIEREHKRSLERSLLQTQELMTLSQVSASLPDRLYLFFCSFLPPAFKIASECASILVSIGSIQSALDIYLKLQLWDEVIACYNHLKLRHKAAEVIRSQIAKKGESVKLLCSLGDATDDVACYDRAWELSNFRSAQAQRHWGMFYFRRKQNKEAIPHLKISLEINSLQVSMWFRLGYAALMEHQWEECAAAYRRFCVLEPDSFEAWNNLAKAYILLEQKERAYYALQEAVKCNYEMWQVWDNLMAVSCDCGDFEEVIRCYHRILDLKDRHMDEMVLERLSSAIIKNLTDCRDRPSSQLRKKALELFGRITSKTMGNATIWQLYAELTRSIEEQTPITKSKTAQYYHKAYTVAIQDAGSFKDVESLSKLLNISQKLAEARLNEEGSQSLGSLKLALENVISRIDQRLPDFEELANEEFQKHFSELKNILEEVKQKVCY